MWNAEWIEHRYRKSSISPEAALVNLGRLWPILKATVSAWRRHNSPRIGAALAFYSLLSLAPMAIVVVSIVSLVFGHASARDHLISEVQFMIGREGAEAVGSMLEHAPQPSHGPLAAIFGFATLLFGASGIFTELRAVLNEMWQTVHLKPDPGIWGTIKDRFFCLGMVLAVGFLLVVSLLLSAFLAAAGTYFSGILPLPEVVISAFNLMFSFCGISLLFALIFRYVPESQIRWRDLWVGAIATGFLFNLGKHLIGLYLGKFAIGSAYGAAGSLVVVIVWVYYSSLVFLFGAEFTRIVESDNRGEPIDAL